jgi:pimeloyl-ACP methyl ester carboxylesterase
MRTFDGLELDVSTYGPEDAPVTAALSHCWTVNQEDWHYQVRALQREFGHRIRILTWDHRGHGNSEVAPKSACTIAHLARDMADVIDTHAPQG